jgi:hypothetical protein
MTPARAEPSPSVSASRAGDRIQWTFRNPGPEPVWAYVRIPTLVDGHLEATDGVAYVAHEGDVAVLRLVDAPVPDDIDAERVTSGAARVEAGAQLQGALPAPEAAIPWEPYGGPDPSARFTPAAWVVEVGWIPATSPVPGEPLPYQGGSCEAPNSDLVPGGQRLVRSGRL